MIVSSPGGDMPAR
jgi:hypothetical protein